MRIIMQDKRKYTEPESLIFQVVSIKDILVVSDPVFEGGGGSYEGYMNDNGEY